LFAELTMPRGTNDGSIRKLIVKKLVKGRPRNVTAYDVIKRYTDVDGRSREKKRRAYSISRLRPVRGEMFIDPETLKQN
jgi:hypothetical protein